MIKTNLNKDRIKRNIIIFFIIYISLKENINIIIMEGLEFLKSMEKLSPEFIQDTGTQQQMKNFWNMLNEMSANNPEVRSK